MLGSNVPTIGGFHTGFKWGDKWGCEVIQIYITLSRRWNVSELTKEEISKFKMAWQKSSVKRNMINTRRLMILTKSKIYFIIKYLT